MKWIFDVLIDSLGYMLLFTYFWIWLFGGRIKFTLNNPFSKEYWNKVRNLDELE